MSDDLRRAVGSAGPILLDFDGPICRVFQHYPAGRVVAELRGITDTFGVQIPPDVLDEEDPLAILLWSSRLSDSVKAALETTLIAEEKKAVRSADPTLGIREVLQAADQAGRPVTVVSNNSAEAIEVFLERNYLQGYIFDVIGRRAGHPELMKPHPHSVEAALEGLAVGPADCAFVGDSLSDIEVGRTVGLRTVGFANRPGKFKALRAAGADAVTESMQDVAECI